MSFGEKKKNYGSQRVAVGGRTGKEDGESDDKEDEEMELAPEDWKDPIKECIRKLRNDETQERNENIIERKRRR